MGIPARPHRVVLTFLHEMGEAGRLEGTPGSCLLSLTGCWAMPKHPHSLSMSRAEPGRQDWRGRVEVATFAHGVRASWGPSIQVTCACHSLSASSFSARSRDTRMTGAGGGVSPGTPHALSVVFSFLRHCQHFLRPPPPCSPSRLPHGNMPPSLTLFVFHLIFVSIRQSSSVQLPTCPQQHPGPWYLPLTASSSGLWPSSLRASTSAPLCSSMVTTAAWPLRAATCSGV